MVFLRHFYLNNKKFDYDLEFENKSSNQNNSWKETTPIIEYCENLGIDIPHYCYHKKLTISGSCRMCLIEIKKSPKPVVACAMNAKSSLGPGIEVFTNSPLVKKSRESVMEFLLLNHPLDCPICDQGGECDLQDQSLFFGFTKKRFYSLKRVVSEKNLGPIIKTVMTRCIHCTRCVRFAHEIAGVEDLGMFGRGINSEIGTYVDKIFQSELSGNMIDICPVGALTSKAYPFNHRSWELRTVKSIDFSDGFGLNIQIMLKNYNIIRILPDMDSETVKNSWISDKTRFSFDGIMLGSKKDNDLFNDNTVTKNVFNSEVKELKDWDVLTQKLVLALYFQDHLSSHFFKEYPLIFVSNEQTPIEILSLILLMSRKYTFVKLKTLSNFKINSDLESSFKINNSLTRKEFENTENCLLVNSNSRFESTHWNLKLRQRYLKGNFKVFSVGPKSDITVPTNELGVNSVGIKSISEGKHLINSKFCDEKTLTVCSAGFLKRNDNKANEKVLELISKNAGYRGIFDLLSKDINLIGSNSISKLRPLSIKDFITFGGIYLLESSLKNFNMNKLIKLKQLDYYFSNDTEVRNNLKILINQNYIDDNASSIVKSSINKKFNIGSYSHFPTKTFFETPASYINAEGLLKEINSGIALLNSSKTSWNILRKVFFDIKRINVTKNPLQNTRIFFSNNSFYRFKDYIRLTLLTSKDLCKSSNNKYVYKSLSIINDFKNFKNSSILKLTHLKKILEDFYLDGEDGYTKNSYTMAVCSKFLRSVNLNFV